METLSKLKSDDDILKREAMLELIGENIPNADNKIANRNIASQIYYNGCVKIVPLNEICWVCPYITQVKQFRYEKYIIEIVDRKVIILNGKMLARTVRVYLYKICGVNEGIICYEKLLGQKQGIGKSKVARTSIGYMQDMLERIRQDFIQEVKEIEAAAQGRD